MRPQLRDSSAVDPPTGREMWLTNRWPELTDLALHQHLVLSRQQLTSLGWTPRRVEHEIRVGRWTAVAPRVVALQNAPLDRIQTCWLGVLHAGPDSALTHTTASERAGLAWTTDPVVHILTARGDVVADLPGVWFHQTRRPFTDWLHPSAHPPRLDVEHAALLTAERDPFLRRGIGLLAAHVQQGLTTADRLVLASHQIRKLRHGSILRLALGDVAGGAHSFAEIDVGRLCREGNVRPPDRQVVRTDEEGRRRYLDCEWVRPDGSIVISGRSVLRCSSIEIRLEPEQIVADLRAIGVPADLTPGFVSARSA